MGTRTFRYHADLAPDGKVFDSDDLPTGDGWVDTPAKFDPNYVEPPKLVPDGTIPDEAARRGYVPVKYPSFRYHRTEEPRKVQSYEEEQALGPDWKESPADFEGEPEPAPEPATDSKDEAQAELLANATIAELKEGLSLMDDVRKVAKLAELESKGANRKGALAVINARLLELSGPQE